MTFLASRRFLHNIFPSCLTSCIFYPHILYQQRTVVPQLFPPQYICSTYPCLCTIPIKFRNDQQNLYKIRDCDEHKVTKYLEELLKEKWTLPEKDLFGEHKITEITLLKVKMIPIGVATLAEPQKKEFNVKKYEDEKFEKYSVVSEEEFKERWD